MSQLFRFVMLTSLMTVTAVAPLWASQRSGDPADRALARQRAAVVGDFPKPVATYTAGRFVVFHDTGEQAARSTAKLLTRTQRQFFAVMRKAGFAVHPLRHRLVCLLFVSKAAFVRYGRAADHQNMAWSGGYYSSRTNRIALYEHDWMPRLAGSSSKAGGDAPMTHGSSGSAGDDGQWAQASLARTTHEAAHLMAFNSGLQKRGVMYPFWVSEGLATSFETEQPAKAFGPGRGNAVRRRGLLTAWRRGRLLPLARFATMTRLPAGDAQTINVAYSQAWGLFEYLYEHRRAALAAYLKMLSHDRIGWQSPAALHRQFTQVFGPIEGLEAGWRAWLATLGGEWSK